MAGVMPMRRESAAAMSHSQSPNTLQYFFLRAFFGALGLAGLLTSEVLTVVVVFSSLVIA